MVLLKNWEDIKKIPTNHMEQKLTINSISVLQRLENIFEGANLQMQAHQCPKCGSLFTVGNNMSETLSKDGDELICKNCGKQTDNANQKGARCINLADATWLIQRWEKLDINTEREFDLLKQQLQGMLQFNTPREMYVEYHKLCKQFGDDYPGMGSKLPLKDQKTISDAFRKAKNDNYEEFLKMIFGVNHVEENEVQEMINMIESAKLRAELEYWLPKIIQYPTFVVNIRTKKELDRYRLKYQLLIYGQLVEFGFIYDIMYNLARIKNNKDWIQEPFPPDKNGNPIFPHSRISKILEEDTKLADILCRYFVPVLRNAISHAKYSVDDNFVYKTDKKTWKMSRKCVTDKVAFARALFKTLLNIISGEQAEIFKQKTKTIGDDEYTFQMNGDYI